MWWLYLKIEIIFWFWSRRGVQILKQDLFLQVSLICDLHGLHVLRVARRDVLRHGHKEVVGRATFYLSWYEMADTFTHFSLNLTSRSERRNCLVLLFTGMNSIFVYAGHSLLGFYFPFSWEMRFQDSHWEKLFQNLWGTALWVFIAYLLYRKRFFLKIWCHEIPCNILATGHYSSHLS